MEEFISIQRVKLIYRLFHTYKGHPIKNDTVSIVNLHARLMKSRTKLARLYGCSHVPFSMCYIVPTFVLGNIRRLRKHAWTAQYKWSLWQHIKMYGLYFH